MIFADTNVIVDVLQDDPRWAQWSTDQLIAARVENDLIINAIVIAELSRGFPDLASLRAALSPFELVVEAISEGAAFLAGQRFVEARRGRSEEASKRPLPDFFIGAHASALSAALLTRDLKLYRHYFPELTLITPETHPHG